MRKIFQLITSIQLGGAENVALDIAEFCGRTGGPNSEITVVELYPTRNSYVETKKEELVSKNIRVITLYRGSKRMSLIFAPFKLLLLMLNEKPAIIHSHTDLPDFVLAMSIRLSRLTRLKMTRLVRTIHNTQLWRTHYRMGKVTETAFHGERIAAVSSYSMIAYEQLRKRYDLPTSPDRQIIYNGRAVPQRLSAPFPISEEMINIAFCGRFEDYKGMETLIPTIREIGRKHPKRFAFHLIGDGTYKEQLKQLTLEQPNVFLHDPIPNVSTLLHVFDYLFMPSHFEGLALVSIEASFSGVPVIASIAPGLDETLPENWPLKFPLNDYEKLQAIFKKIYNNEYDRGELQKTAYDFVNRNFSLEKMIHSYNKLYTEML